MTVRIDEIYYEATGTRAMRLFKAHFDQRAKARRAIFSMVRRLFGAETYRPNSHDGKVWTLVYKALRPIPAGLRQLNKAERRKLVLDRVKYVEVVPDNTTAGRAIRDKLDAVEGLAPAGVFLAKAFKWGGERVMKVINESRGTCVIMIPWVQHLSLPYDRYFARAAYTKKKGRIEGLTEIRESDYVRALEDHNMAVEIKLRRKLSRRGRRR